MVIFLVLHDFIDVEVSISTPKAMGRGLMKCSHYVGPRPEFWLICRDARIPRRWAERILAFRSNAGGLHFEASGSVRVIVG